MIKVACVGIIKNNNSILEKMYNLINTHKRFSIFMHENPDLDTI